MRLKMKMLENICVNLGSQISEYLSDITIKQTIDGFDYKKSKYFCSKRTLKVDHHIRWKTKYICNQLYQVPDTRYL